MTKMTIKKRKEAIIDALRKNMGIVSAACKKANISRETHYRWIREDVKYREAVEAIQEEVLDMAESQLYKEIKNGNTAALIFFLKTKGKKRGYTENEPLNIEPVQINIHIIENKKEQ